MYENLSNGLNLFPDPYDDSYGAFSRRPHDAPPRDLREKVAYDSREQPLYIHKNRLSQYAPNMAALCHWHEDVEFLCIVHGHMAYHVEGTVFRLEEGNGIFVNSRQLHFGYSDDGSDCEFLCILLNPLLLSSSIQIERKYIAPLTSNRSLPCMPLERESGWQSEILDRLREVESVYASGRDAFEMELQILFYRIWLLLWRHRPENSARPDRVDRSALVEMLRYLRRHFTEKIPVSALSAAGGVSQSKCFQLFRECAGCTPSEYLTAYRLRESCRLLAESDLSMTEIAGQVGFNSSSYYAERFRQYFGCTPGLYRKEHAK